MINQERYPQSIYKFTNNFIRVTIPYTDGFMGYHASNTEATTEATTQATTQADKLFLFCRNPRSRIEIQEHLGFKNNEYFRKSILNPLIVSGQIAMTISDKPTSPNQKFYTAQASDKKKGDNNE